MKSNLVSVIITTKNSAKTLENLLKSVKRQTYKKIEIIIVDNKSTDSTLYISKKYSNKIYQKGSERSAQRNYGTLKSKGSYFLFLDSDMILEKNVISENVRLAKNNLDKCEIVIPETSFGKGFWAKTKILERNINSGETYFEAARFFPKQIFKKAKGYDENLTGPEDWDLSQRIAKKYPVFRIKSKILHNEGNLSISYLMKKKYYYGISAHKYLIKQKIPLISPVTVYFLRPAFYKKWRILLKNPLIAVGMIIMLSLEIIAGLTGYVQGRLKNEKW